MSNDEERPMTIFDEACIGSRGKSRIRCHGKGHNTAGHAGKLSKDRRLEALEYAVKRAEKAADFKAQHGPVITLKPMTIDDYITRRNEIQLASEEVSEERAQACWASLGIANRHIERVLAGRLPFSLAVEKEIRECLTRALLELHRL